MIGMFDADHADAVCLCYFTGFVHCHGGREEAEGIFTIDLTDDGCYFVEDGGGFGVENTLFDTF